MGKKKKERKSLIISNGKRRMWQEVGKKYERTTRDQNQKSRPPNLELMRSTLEISGKRKEIHWLRSLAQTPPTFFETTLLTLMAALILFWPDTLVNPRPSIPLSFLFLQQTTKPNFDISSLTLFSLSKYSPFFLLHGSDPSIYSCSYSKLLRHHLHLSSHNPCL